MERRDTKLSFEIKYVLANDGCIFPLEIPGHQPDYTALSVKTELYKNFVLKNKIHRMQGLHQKKIKENSTLGFTESVYGHE